MRRALLATAVLLALTIGSPLEAEAQTRASITVSPAQPHFGDTLTFAVDAGTSQPYVTAFCWQGGKLWFYETHPYFAPYLPNSEAFVLPASLMPGTAASCTARVYKVAKNGVRLLAETTFTIQP